MTADEIKAEIAAGSISAITLDTSAFGKPSEMSLEHGLLARLRQFSGTGVQFVMSDVVLKEVESHMARGATESLSQLEKAMKAVGGSWNIPRAKRDAARTELTDNESPREMARRRVEAFADDTECTIIKAAEHANMERLVRGYFASEPPFADKETKKNEFPDAIALMSLDGWAEACDTKMLVVSNDDDWARYCDKSERLILVRTLSEAYRLFNADAEVACSALSLMLNRGDMPEWREAIERAAQAHVDSMWLSADADSMFQYDEEISEVVVIGVQFSDKNDTLTPIEMSEESLVAELNVSVELEVTGDFSFYVTDSIDKDNVNMGGTSITCKDTIEMRMLITFVGHTEDDAEIDDIEVEGTKSHYVSFGTVEPDWMNDPSNYD